MLFEGGSFPWRNLRFWPSLFGTWPLKALADAHGRPDFAELTLKETALDSPEFRRDQLTNRAH